MTPVRLEPAALRSRVKHSTTEPLRSRLLIELGPICNSMADHCDLRVVRTTAYLKAIMEVYGKTITGLGPKGLIFTTANSKDPDRTTSSEAV